MSDLKLDIEKEKQIFLNFHYKEIKDLSKHFLTLTSGVLVLTIAFSEKIIDFNEASLNIKYLLVVACSLLLFAIIGCGLGICFIFWAADCATGEIIYNYGKDYKKLTKLAYIILNIAGTCFSIGLFLLISLLFIKLFN